MANAAAETFGTETIKPHFQTSFFGPRDGVVNVSTAQKRRKKPQKCSFFGPTLFNERDRTDTLGFVVSWNSVESMRFSAAALLKKIFPLMTDKQQMLWDVLFGCELFGQFSVQAPIFCQLFKKFLLNSLQFFARPTSIERWLAKFMTNPRVFEGNSIKFSAIMATLKCLGSVRAS